MCILTSFTLRFYTVMKSFKNATFSNSSYFQLCRIMQSSKPPALCICRVFYNTSLVVTLLVYSTASKLNHRCNS